MWSGRQLVRKISGQLEAGGLSQQGDLVKTMCVIVRPCSLTNDDSHSVSFGWQGHTSKVKACKFSLRIVEEKSSIGTRPNTNA